MKDEHTPNFIVQLIRDGIRHTAETGIIIGEMWKSVLKSITEQDK